MNVLSTVATFGFDDFDPPRILSLYRRLGCATCQFYRNEANPPDEETVKRICAEADLVIDSIHGVFGNAYDPSSPKESVRAASIETYRREGLLTRRLGGNAVVVHPACNVPPERSSTPADQQRRLACLERSIDELARIGRDIGVVYLIENLPPQAWVGTQPRRLAQMVRRADSPNLRMCFDIGHAHLTDHVVEALIECADVIDYLHVHDNDGKQDSHLMPGDGAIDWDAIGDALRRTHLSAPAMLEVFYLQDQLEALAESDLAHRLVRWLNISAEQHAS